MYRAAPGIYAAPLDRPFIVYCGPQKVLQRCNVAYQLSPHVRAYYRFETAEVPTRLSPNRIALEDLVPFDRDLRARIEAARVKGFRGADDPPP